MLPFLAVAVVMILVFLILVAMVSHQGTEKWETGFKKTIIVLVFIAVIIAGLIVTGAWDYLAYKFSGPYGSDWFTNAVFIAIIIGAALLVFFSDKKHDGDKKEKS